MEKVLNASIKLMDSVQEDVMTEQNLMLMAEKLFRKCSTIKLPKIEDCEVEPIGKQLEEAGKISSEIVAETEKMEKNINELIRKLESRTEKCLIKSRHLSSIPIDYLRIVNDTKQSSFFLSLTLDSIEKEKEKVESKRKVLRKRKADFSKILSAISEESSKVTALQNQIVRMKLEYLRYWQNESSRVLLQ